MSQLNSECWLESKWQDVILLQIYSPLPRDCVSGPHPSPSKRGGQDLQNVRCGAQIGRERNSEAVHPHVRVSLGAREQLQLQLQDRTNCSLSDQLRNLPGCYSLTSIVIPRHRSKCAAVKVAESWSDSFDDMLGYLPDKQQTLVPRRIPRRRLQLKVRGSAEGRS